MTWIQKGNHNLTITNSNLTGTFMLYDTDKLPSTAISTSYKVHSFLGSRIPANSSHLRPISWSPWTKRSSNGDDKSSASLQPSPPQSSPVGISSSSPCQVMPSKHPNSVASGAAKTAAHAKRQSPTAFYNAPSTNKPTIPPIHRQPRHSDQIRPTTGHCGPTPLPKSMLTLNSPSANPPPPTQQEHQVSLPPAPHWPHSRNNYTNMPSPCLETCTLDNNG